MNNAIFIIGNIGDYHAPRLKLLSSDLLRVNVNLKIIELDKQSKFYSHSQTRKEKIKKKLNVKELTGTKGIAKYFAILISLVRTSPEIIYVLGYSSSSSLIALAYRLLFSKKIIFMSDSKADDHIRTELGEFVKSQLLKGFDGALVAGEKHKNYFASLGMPKKNIRVGYDVIDNKYFNSMAVKYKRRITRLKKFGHVDSQYLLCVSRFVKRKRVDLVLKSYAASTAKIKGFKLVLVGDGPELSRILQLIEQLDIVDNVIILDNVKNSRMPLLYSFAKFVLLLSEFDQWGLCINESLATATPVIATERCGAADEILINDFNGYVIKETDNSIHIAALIDGLLDDNEKLNYYSNNCEKIMRHWDLERFSKSCVSFF